jgi:hypothetical protein
MLRQNVHTGRNDINRIAFNVKGVRNTLTPITKIEFRILELNITIINSISTDFPIKWELDPVEIGVMEYKIGDLMTEEIPTFPTGIYQIDVFVFDSSSLNGIYFNSFEINVKL